MAFLILLVFTINSGNLKAQSMPNNQRTNIMKESVVFKNANLKMAGNLYLPEGFDQSKKYAAIIVVHPGGGVKEQTSAIYANELAQRGFITLAYDASHQGESEGEPRYLENPTERVEDIRSAVDYLTTLPYIDIERIGAMGICAGGGYAVSAAQTEKRIKAVAGVSAVDIGMTFRGGWDGKVTLEQQLETMQAVAKQRTAEANGAEPKYEAYVPNVVDETTVRDMVEAHEYYRTPRGQHPNSKNLILVRSYDKILSYSAFSQIDNYLTQPLLMIAGSEAGSRWQSEKAIEMAKEPRELFIVDGATHIALYDVPEYVQQAVGKLTGFFNKNLYK